MVINFIDMPTQALIALNAQASLNSSFYNSTNYHYQYTGVDKLSPSAFADAVYGPLFAPGLGTDMYYNSCNIDLSNATRSYNIPSFKEWLENNPISFRAGNIPPFTPGSYDKGGNNDINDDSQAQGDSEKVTERKYNSKLKLVQAYLNYAQKNRASYEAKEKYNEVLKEFNKIKDYTNKENAVKALDKLIAKLNKDDLISAVRLQVEDDNKNAVTIAEKWNEQLNQEVDRDSDLSEVYNIKDKDGVNKNNILNILSQLDNSSNFELLIMANDDIVQMIIEKGEELKQHALDHNNETKANDISSAIESLKRANAQSSDGAEKCYNLYKVLREYDNSRSDADILINDYGMPEDMAQGQTIPERNKDILNGLSYNNQFGSLTLTEHSSTQSKASTEAQTIQEQVVEAVDEWSETQKAINDGKSVSRTYRFEETDDDGNMQRGFETYTVAQDTAFLHRTYENGYWSDSDLQTEEIDQKQD